MHSALPKAISDTQQPRFDPKKPVYRALLVVLSLAAFFTWALWVKEDPLFGQKVYYKGGVRANADTVEQSRTPYIYPELSDLESYRSGGWVKFGADKSVKSSRHSIIYMGSNSPRVVMVVGLDDSFSQEHLENVLQDRLDYARQHGFGLYARYLNDFATKPSDDESSGEFSVEFAKVLMVREAMYAFRDSQWMWWLDQDAVIKNHDFDLENELLNPSNLQKHMVRDAPILPPESIIHTYKRVSASHIKFILTQNDRGMSTASFLVMNDELYGRVLMGYWSDPLHRSYPGFQGFSGYNGHVEASLTHMVQWHPAILSRMAVVPHKYLGSRPDDGQTLKGQQYKQGDFVQLVRDGNEVDYPGAKRITEDWIKAKASP